jgi:hypothetical protein
MPQLNFPAPGSPNAVQHLTSFGGFDVTPVFTYRYTNLLIWTEDLTRTNWLRQTGNTTFTADFDNVNYYQYDNDPILPNGVTVFRNNDDSFNITVTANSTSFGQRISVLPNTTYTLSFYAKSGTAANVFYRIVDNTNSLDIVQATNYTTNINANTFSRIVSTFTTGSQCNLSTIFLVDNTVGSNFGSVNVYWPQLELGSTPTEYNSTQANSYAILGLSTLSPNLVSVSGNLTDYVDYSYDFPPIINILGVSTVTYETANYYINDLDVFQPTVSTSATKILYIPEQAVVPYAVGENIRVTDAFAGITKIYTVAACTTRTVTINTTDPISEKFVILARGSSPVYTQDKIINDFRLNSFVGNISSPKANYYISTYFGIPYRAQVILGTDKINYSFVDARPADNKVNDLVTKSHISFAQRSQFVIKGFNESRILPGILNRDSLKLREINLNNQLKLGAFKSSSVYVFKEGTPSRSLLPVFLNRNKTLPLRPDISWVSNNPMGFGVRAIFKQEQDATNLSLSKRSVVNLETKLRSHPTNLADRAVVEPKFSNFMATRESYLAPLPKISVIGPRFFVPPPDRREATYIQPQMVFRRMHDVYPQHGSASFAQLDRDRTKVIPADRFNLFHKVDQATLRLRPENLFSVSTDALLDNVSLIEKRISGNFHTLTDIEFLRTRFARLDSNVVTTVTRNNISNVTTLTSKSSYTAQERYLIDLLKPIYKSQFINTNINLDAVSLNLENVLKTQGKVIPVIKASTLSAVDFDQRVNLLQKQVFTLRTDNDRTLRNTARLGRLAMANVAMAISSHIERFYYQPIPVRIVPRFSVPVNELYLARVNRTFIRHKFTHLTVEKPASFKIRPQTGFIPDKLGITGTISRISNINPAFNKFYVVNDEPLRNSFAGLRKYINEGIVQPPMQVIGQSGITNNLVQLYLDDDDILTLTAGNTTPTQSVTINPVVRLESPAVYFDGYQDYIESSPSAMLGFGSVPTTIEMMIRPMARSPIQVITSLWSNSNFYYTDKLDIYLNSQLQICFGQVYPRSLDIFSPVKGAYETRLFCRTEQPLNTSYITHLAIVIQNNTVTVYFNGAQQTIVGTNQVIGPSGNAQFRIGFAGAPQPSWTFVSNI